MSRPSRAKFATVAALVLVGTVVPMAVYGVLAACAPNITPEEAKRRLADVPAAALLVDVRQSEKFAAGHIEGAVNWPLAEILAVAGPDQIAAQRRRMNLFLICDVGIASRQAAWHLRTHGLAQASNVRGGIQEWMRSAPQREGGDWDRWREPDGLRWFPFRQSPPLEQFLAVFSYFFLKPIYMTLSLAIVLVLWRSTSGDLAALRYGMAAFLVGETACAVNYFGYQETSYLWEYLHAAGMFVCFGFLTYALIEAIDGRILGLSDPERRCAATRLCGACIKQTAVPCGLKHAFYLLIPTLIALAMMIPTADWHDTSYNTLIYGHAYNYGHLRAFQQVENWYCPAAAVLMLGVSLVAMLLSRQQSLEAAKIAFAAGVGPLGFGMLRMLLGAAYDQNRVWFLFWEEATELMMAVGVCGLLWIFRRGLFPGFDVWFRSLLGA
ncbi:MAG: rhodanese-like domain-containing protein [Thermoguttaceae bacterium]|jgi:rhodanese-related sulfurtransferase